MILGTGSVTDAATASLYMSLGSNFIVTPVSTKELVSGDSTSFTITFDPDTDTFVNKDGILELSGTKPGIEKDILRYFTERKEDG